MRKIPKTTTKSRKNIIRKKHSKRKTQSKKSGGAPSPPVTDYSNQDLSNNNFSDMNLKGVNFSGAKLSGANFSGANLTGATLSGVDLEGANLEGANLEGVDLSDLDLESLNMQRVNLQDAELNKVNLTGANLTGANLKFANIQHSLLIGSNFTGANLEGAILTGADLSWANFSGANLTGANLTGANLTDGYLGNANLTGADMTAVITNDNTIFTLANFTDITVEDDSVLRSMLDPPTSTSTSTLREQLLQRKSVKLTEYAENPFKNGILSSYNVILLEDVNYCEYIKNKNNLLIFFGKQVAVIERDTLTPFIESFTVNPDNIVYRCKEVDGAFLPRDSNIISGPALNMTAIGLNGPIVPLEYLDEVVKGDHQIFMIEPTDNVKEMPIASLGTRLGGSVVSANHCQANVNKQMCTISYIENSTLLEACKTSGAKTGGKKKRTTRKKKIQKRKGTTKQKI